MKSVLPCVQVTSLTDFTANPGGQAHVLFLQIRSPPPQSVSLVHCISRTENTHTNTHFKKANYRGFYISLILKLVTGHDEQCHYKNNNYCSDIVIVFQQLELYVDISTTYEKCIFHLATRIRPCIHTAQWFPNRLYLNVVHTDLLPSKRGHNLLIEISLKSIIIQF